MYNSKYYAKLSNFHKNPPALFAQPRKLFPMLVSPIPVALLAALIVGKVAIYSPVFLSNWHIGALYGVNGSTCGMLSSSYRQIKPYALRLVP